MSREKYGVKQQLTEEEKELFKRLKKEGKVDSKDEFKKEGDEFDGIERKGNILVDVEKGSRPFERKE